MSKSKLERAVRRTRKAVPSLKELEISLSEERNDSSVRELFQGWIERNSLPPEQVLLCLIKETRYNEQRRFCKN